MHNAIKPFFLMMSFLASLCLLPWLPAAAGSTVPPAATDTAYAYFDALRSGNLQALRSLLGAREAEGIRDQLEDPGYSQFLTDRYSNARLEVMDSGNRGAFTYVDVRIWLNDRESVAERLIMKPVAGSATYRIVRRRALN